MRVQDGVFESGEEDLLDVVVVLGDEVRGPAEGGRGHDVEGEVLHYAGHVDLGDAGGGERAGGVEEGD